VQPDTEKNSAAQEPRWFVAIDRLIGRIVSAGLILVLPVSLLLFLQWPLRELVQAYSREANDLAQWLFALYVSIAVTYATRAQTHLAADSFAQRYPQRWRARLSRAASLLVLVPWAAFVVYAAWPMIVQSVSLRESFPDTYNPGYFIVKISIALLALLVLAQAVIDVVKSATHPPIDTLADRNTGNQ
jgi:TRAP-type mannitol/chloroaromatic compound transport system permease small subunit